MSQSDNLRFVDEEPPFGLTKKEAAACFYFSGLHPLGRCNDAVRFTVFIDLCHAMKLVKKRIEVQKHASDRETELSPVPSEGKGDN